MGRSAWAVLALVAAAAISGCKGDTGDAGVGVAGPAGTPAPFPPTRNVIANSESLPGVVVKVVSLGGATGQDGAFRVGDKIAVRFTLARNDGAPFAIAEMTRADLVVGGEVSNYQRVLVTGTARNVAAGTNPMAGILANTVLNSDGSYTFTFPEIPGVYPAQLGQTSSTGSYTDPDGNDWGKQGKALIAGTYTVGLCFEKDYTVGAATGVKDSGVTTKDFLCRGAADVDPGAVSTRKKVAFASCNACHTALNIHGSRRTGDSVNDNISLCLLCHTAGARAGSVTIDFKVMIHKIHNGSHLPSVNGVATKDDGTRDYGVTPTAYAIGSSDWSDVNFPMFPSFSVSMPSSTDFVGDTATIYKNLAGASVSKTTKNTAITRGVADCDSCHVDQTTLKAPTSARLQSGAWFDGITPSRAACGSCHDDIAWHLPYAANGTIMPPGSGTYPPPASDLMVNCSSCHAPYAGAALNTVQGLAATIVTPTAQAHLHPMRNTTFNPGYKFASLKYIEAGTNNANGKLDVGEKIGLSFKLQSESGTTTHPLSTLGTFENVRFAFTGPSGNRHRITYASFAKSTATAPTTFTPTNFINGCTETAGVITIPTLPEQAGQEFLGTVAAHPQTLTASRSFWQGNVLGVNVFVVTATAGDPAPVASAAAKGWNSIEVVTPSANFNIVDEWVQISTPSVPDEWRLVSRRTLVGAGKLRLWFDPALVYARPLGTTVQRALVETKGTSDFTVAASSPFGQISFSNAAKFPTGTAVLITYWTDFVVPQQYPGAVGNGKVSGDFQDESWGSWLGKSLVDGTYTIGVWGVKAIGKFPGRTQSASPTYNSFTNPANIDVLLGSATTVEPQKLIESASKCNACHSDHLFIHGGSGRRGFETCILCHSQSNGFQVQANSPTVIAGVDAGYTVDFRTMLHKIHMGKELANASTYAGGGFEEIGFPAMPSGVKECAKCHGTATAWQEPADRSHPTEQGNGAQTWRAVCTSCHDKASVASHVELMTTPTGGEACSACHGPGSELGVDVVHKVH